MDEDTEIGIVDDDFLFYSLLYSSTTVVFAMAVLSKFLTNEFRFGFRSLLSLVILFVGEPFCQFLLKGPSGVMAFGFGCLLIYSVLPASHLPAVGKTVLITGCDSGFGHDIARKLDSIGMQVFAGCLHKNGPGAIELKNSCSPKLKVIQLNVTEEKEIKEAYDTISQQVGDEGLWGLVNNAGMWYAGDLEMTPEKLLRRLMDVNLFGMIRVTQTVLPLIRQAKGRVVNMSSLVGRIPFPAYGSYSISKAGVEAFSDCLRMEMRKWGVIVSVIEPSAFKTGALKPEVVRERREEMWDNLDENTKATYGREYLDKIYGNIMELADSKYPTDLTSVVRAVRSGLLSKRPMERCIVGRGAGVFLTVFSVLPVWLGDKVVNLLDKVHSGVNPLALQN